MTNPPIRVLQVVQRYYPELGGLETHVAEVTSRLAGRPDLQITILTTDRSGRLPREDEINGVRVIRRRSWPRDKDFYLSPGLIKVIRGGDWDVVHFQGGQTLVPLVGMLAAWSARIPYVLTFHSGGHSTTSRSRLGDLQTRILRPLLARSAKLIAVSRFEKKRFAAETGIDADHFVVINNGGALPAVPAGTTSTPGTIVSSGRLEKYKGHHRAIQALPLVQQSIPAARLTILGGGPYEADLRALADELGVSDTVTIRHLPPTERAQMAEILASSSVMTALSTYEAHPVGIMEALAIGLPVLGCDTAGIGDLVEDGLVRGIDRDAAPDQVAAALVDMLSGPTESPRRPADFALPTWEQCADDVARVYHEVARAAGIGRPLRIAQVIATLTTGGAERQLESLVQHSRHAHRVIAVYSGGAVADTMAAAGVDIGVLGMGGLRKVTAIPRLALRLRRMRPDIVHVHLLTGQLWGIPAARLAGVRTIISTEHSLMETTIENRPHTARLRTLYRMLERMATRTIAVSETTKVRLQRWGIDPVRISVIDNGIDFAALAFNPDDRKAIRQEFSVDGDTELVGAVGRLEPVKRFPELLEALAPTLSRGRRELLLVGAGPLQETLRLRAEQLGVGAAVHLTGPRSDVPALLAGMDVLISASRDETFGMAVLEGLGAGLPVVYAQCPALDEIGERPDWAYPLADASAEPGSEAADIRRITEVALSVRSETRFPLPASLARAFGITETAERVDSLYSDLVGSRPARRRPRFGGRKR